MLGHPALSAAPGRHREPRRSLPRVGGVRLRRSARRRPHAEATAPPPPVVHLQCAGRRTPRARAPGRLGAGGPQRRTGQRTRVRRPRAALQPADDRGPRAVPALRVCPETRVRDRGRRLRPAALRLHLPRRRSGADDAHPLPGTRGGLGLPRPPRGGSSGHHRTEAHRQQPARARRGRPRRPAAGSKGAHRPHESAGTGGGRSADGRRERSADRLG